MLIELTKFRVYFAGICSLIVTVGVARFSYSLLLPVMQDSAGLTESGGGWLATANFMGYMSGVLLAASLHNLHLKYYLQRAYLLLSVLTSVAMVMTTDIIAWAILRFIAGICASGGFIIASGLILKWLVRHNHRAELVPFQFSYDRLSYHSNGSSSVFINTFKERLSLGVRLINLSVS
ncbi:YbfB/YjiJ family MFS transporter, partial [Shewanella ulleungensis]|uniref:YbfB/YjiJ family MFS transporter n=1 Tax=Shewanella ulleungensis TaxID=2282699 RepID=UPI003D7B885B